MKIRKSYLFFTFCFLLLSFNSLKAQVENVIVETYYISDANDVKNSTGVNLEPGSKTYRIFIDLAEGTKLRKIYGDVNHALKFSSTANFFNNTDRGTSFGKDINDKKINENTLALDSWITLGLATRKHTGILKTEDTDGSILVGENPTYGVLLNADPKAGKPLTIADGLIVADSLPKSWISYGITDLTTGEDSTILGSVKLCSQFISNNAGLQCSGVKGPSSDNKVLIAQLTTKGDISFEINIDVDEKDGNSFKTVKYVANGNKLLPGERLCAYLKYPQKCGCTDTKFREYNPQNACSNADSCKTLIVFGCTDPMACNYDQNANFNIQDLCCYPGNCNDRDISLVCPQLGKNEFYIKLYPNPVKERLEIQISSKGSEETKLVVYDYIGRLVLEKNIGAGTDNTIHQEDVSKLRNGLYFIRLSTSNSMSATKTFMKN